MIIPGHSMICVCEYSNRPGKNKDDDNNNRSSAGWLTGFRNIGSPFRTIFAHIPLFSMMIVVVAVLKSMITVMTILLFECPLSFAANLAARCVVCCVVV